MKIYEKKNYYKKDEYEGYTHKYCSYCNELKPVNEFSKNNTPRSRLGWTYRSWCIECNKLSCRKYSVGNRDKRNDRLKKYRKTHPEKMKIIDRRRSLKRKYGITIDDYNKMFIEQNGKCFICGLEKKLVVDHDHKTGEIRKLLCHGCNTVLGKIEKGEFEIYQNYIKTCHADILLKLANTDMV